jgi:hypothetical protein
LFRFQYERLASPSLDAGQPTSIQSQQMTGDELQFLAARSRVAALRAMLAKTEGAPVRLIETHISWVLIGRDLAFKLKKPIRLPFLDFRTLANRRHSCDEELRLNLRSAPDLYIDVVDVREGPDGPCFGGAGRLLDFAVRMHRFPDGALWSERLAREHSQRGKSMPLHAASSAIIAAPQSRHRSAPSARRPFTTEWSAVLSLLSTLGKPALSERTRSGQDCANG